METIKKRMEELVIVENLIDKFDFDYQEIKDYILKFSIGFILLSISYYILFLTKDNPSYQNKPESLAQYGRG